MLRLINHLSELPQVLYACIGHAYTSRHTVSVPVHNLGYVSIHQVLHAHALSVNQVLFVHVEPSTLTQVPRRGCAAGFSYVTSQEALDCRLFYTSATHSHNDLVVTHTVNQLLPHRTRLPSTAVVDTVNHLLSNTLHYL